MVQTRRTAAAAAAAATAAVTSTPTAAPPATKDTTASDTTKTVAPNSSSTTTTAAAPTPTTTTTTAAEMMTPTTTSSTTKNNARFNAEAAAWDSNPFIQAMSAEAWRAIQNNVTCFRDSSDDASLPARPDVLEIGCGTGTLSLLVAPHARQLVAVDAAEGMVEVLRGKLADNAAVNEKEDSAGKGKKSRMPKLDFGNVVPVCVMLEDPEDPSLPPGTEEQQQQQHNGHGGVGGRPDRIKFDLVISHLVLHHIPDLAPVLGTMLGCLKPGGVAALTDFEDFGPEARRFHPEGKMEGVERHGIEKEGMRRLMREVGFADVRVEVAWTASKSVERFPGEFGDKAEGGEGKGEMMEFPFLICTGKRP
ncbi:S-adenosyl-L-methionine-dependent methyltransferase [Apiospora marii]|uniref:S-adenosyl-L-methionine-dependent methyltransferase n=1 Tax=Apiospora marii TaxID=335849 RepID=UPI00312E3148